MMLVDDKTAVKQVVIVFLLCTLSACASSSDGSSDPQDDEPKGRSDCILKASIRDYRVLDDANLVVTASGQRKYLVVLSRRAIGLKSGWNIGFSARTSRICAGFGEVLVEEQFDGFEAYRIAHIQPLNTAEYEELMIRYGKMKPELEQTPEPEDVDGAEVEELD